MPTLRFLTIAWVAFLMVLAGGQIASAQVQRAMVNPSFESNNPAGNPGYEIFPNNSVAGWNSTSGEIELWDSGFQSVTALAGNGSVFAEMNANTGGALYQDVCVVSGETISWTFYHKARSGGANPQTANFQIANSSGTVLQTLATQSSNISTNGSAWNTNTGSAVYSGASGIMRVQFSTPNSGSYGNLLDNTQITLRPVIEFSSSTYSTREGQTVTVPQLLVVGTVPTGGAPVTITATGTATGSGTDYTLGTFTIPAGVYATPTAVPLTGLLSIVDDSLIENNETVVLSLAASALNYNVSSTASCGGAGTGLATYTILDNDVDVRTTKTVDSATPAGGGTAIFTVTYQNNTAAPTVGTGTDLQAHTASVTLADALPAGFTGFSWTCAASGSPAPTCPAASGTGAINTAASLPAGAGAAGGTLTFTVTGTLNATQCSSTTNTSTVTAAAPLAEGTAVQAGFVSPAPGGTANNTASVAVDPLCADFSIKKTNTAGVNNDNDQTNDTLVAGSSTTYTITVTNSGPDATSGAIVRDVVGSGLTCASANAVSCSPAAACAGPYSVGGLTGSSGIALGTVTAGQSVTLSFACAVN